MQATSEAFAPLGSNNGAMEKNRNSAPLFSTVQVSTASSSSSGPSITIQPVTIPQEDEVIGTRPRIVSIESAEDFKAFLEEGHDDEEERLTVLKFHANWCKLCQRFGEQYKRIGREIGDLEEVTLNDDDEEAASVVRKGEIRMGEIEYGANADLCKSLGVTKLPAVHIYSSKGRLVDAIRCGANKLSAFLDKLDMYLSMSPAEVDFAADMLEGVNLGNNVLDTLNKEIANSNTGTPAKQPLMV
jgi:thiol-disulfide isomerase/thioredoxin